MLIHIYRIYTCIRGIHPYKQCIYKPFGIAAARLSDLTAIIIVGSFDSSGRVSSPLVWVLGYKSGFWTFTNWRSRVATCDSQVWLPLPSEEVNHSTGCAIVWPI